MFDRRFKFYDLELQQRLLSLMEAAGVKLSVDADGVVRFSSHDEHAFDDAAVDVRNSVFPQYPWHVCQCELDEVPKYIDYMNRHGIPHVQELNDNEPWFLLERRYDPEQWGIW
jgi:hypothetical protein